MNTGTQQVTKNGESVAFPKLSYQLLVILVETAPNVVTQDELINRVWPGRQVGHDTITQRIRLLRRALGDKSQLPCLHHSARARLIAPIPALRRSENRAYGKEP